MLFISALPSAPHCSIAPHTPQPRCPPSSRRRPSPCDGALPLAAGASAAAPSPGPAAFFARWAAAQTRRPLPLPLNHGVLPPVDGALPPAGGALPLAVSASAATPSLAQRPPPGSALSRADSDLSSAMAPSSRHTAVTPPSHHGLGAALPSTSDEQWRR
ncbi:hypothetical protein OsI_14857 [Oryza sativa Indica Group]|uniref:Uncharacterized protein n=1 Tax=Oryza sativa subsp. indica TaxID=39946 RepID=B8AVA2_ORYSI|nr:hypothetical protein OsI_14857 [Oryza sativa Indica Group]